MTAETDADGSRANDDEGADPSDDIARQNPGQTTTRDLPDDSSPAQPNDGGEEK